MYITTAREFLRDAARNANSTAVYPTRQVDRAIYLALKDFLISTRAYRGTMYIPIDFDLSFNAIVTGATGYESDFRPEMIRTVRLTDTTNGDPISQSPDPLEVVSYAEASRLYAMDSSAGYPTHIGFLNLTTFGIWPIGCPEELRLNIDFWLPERSWTFGTEIAPRLTASISGGAVVSVSVSGGGGEYANSVPNLTFSGGGGSGATATAVLDSTGNTIQSVTVTGAGSGYSSAPTVTVTGKTADFELRCPDAFVDTVITTKAAVILMASTPECQGLLPGLEARYEMFKRRHMDANNDGSRVFARSMLGDW